ncbi:MAG: hypothetical protein IPM53_10755 [Anaerolineaceae bacterium]|nr:hypothetical protein [Anaerolineaceae bacterium]
MKRLVAGFIAGTLATVPMTMFMLVMHYLLVSDDERSMPPYEITMRASDKTGFWHKLLGEEERKSVTLAAHFGYGGMAGMLYALLPRLVSLPAVVHGMGFGIFFWAANYLGILPALNLFPHQLHDHPGRRAATIGAHVVWGAALGQGLAQLAGGGQPSQMVPVDNRLPPKETMV